MRTDLDARGLDDHSVVGEEDPGAAMDLVCGALEIGAPWFASAELANPENPSVEVADAKLADVAVLMRADIEACDATARNEPVASAVAVT